MKLLHDLFIMSETIALWTIWFSCQRVVISAVIDNIYTNTEQIYILYIYLQWAYIRPSFNTLKCERRRESFGSHLFASTEQGYRITNNDGGLTEHKLLVDLLFECGIATRRSGATNRIHKEKREKKEGDSTWWLLFRIVGIMSSYNRIEEYSNALATVTAPLQCGFTSNDKTRKNRRRKKRIYEKLHIQ